MRCLLARLRPFALFGGFGGAVLVLALAAILDFGFGEDVLMIAPHDPGTVKINRAMYMSGDPVAELYGSPLSNPIRLIAPDQDHILRPKEDDSIVLFTVDRQQGENPLQARTVWLFAKFAALGFGLLGFAGLFFPRSCVVAARDGRNDPRPRTAGTV